MKNKSFNIATVEDIYRKKDVIITSLGGGQFKVLKVYHRVWYNRVLVWLRIKPKPKILRFKVKEI